MVNRQRQSGFSLIEVLFALAVLTMGLAFVASQFPVALMQSRQVSRAVLEPVNAHNSAAMQSLKLEGETVQPSPQPQCPAWMNAAGDVHLLYQPNLLVDDDVVVMDDPCNMYFEAAAPTDGLYPDGYSKDLPGYILTYEDYAGGSSYLLGRGNLGSRVQPLVLPDDEEVLERALTAFGETELALLPFFAEDPTSVTPEPTDAEYTTWNTIIGEVAMTRTKATCSFYRCLNPGGTGNTFQLITLTCSLSPLGQRYAMQDRDGFLPDGAGAFDDEQDRYFPVPWLITLDYPLLLDPDDERFLDDDGGGFSNSTYDMAWPADRIYLHWGSSPYDFISGAGYEYRADAIMNLMRKGTVLINEADGAIYTVDEITTADKEGGPGPEPMLRLNRPLESAMQSFWLIPPPIVTHGGGGAEDDTYAQDQTVIGIKQTTIRFQE